MGQDLAIICGMLNALNMNSTGILLTEKESKILLFLENVNQ